MPVPFADLIAQYRAIQPEIDAAISRVIGTAGFILGREVEAFEQAFAEACGSRFAVGVASGTAALRLTLQALGIGPGDDVVTTPFTFAATAEAIVHRGARPVFVDIDPTTYMPDPARVERAITPGTRALIVVHLYGRPADMDPIRSIAQTRKLRVIEDAAQAHLARYRGRAVGGLGDAACFSFFPAKNLGAYGDGGMVVTRDASVAHAVALLRNHGRTTKYLHEIVGDGERLDGLQAAILSAKLPHLAAWNERRRAVAAAYRRRLAGLPLQLPAEDAECESVYHLFVVRTPQREALRAHLKRCGISTGVHYPLPLHLQPAFAFLGHRRGDFPEAERAAEEVLSLPLYPELSEGQLNEVCDAIAAFFQQAAGEPAVGRLGRSGGA